MLYVALFCLGFGALILVAESLLENNKLESQILKQEQALQEKPCFYVRASGLNVRKNPNMQAKILQTLPNGAQVCKYFEVESGFLRIDEGYVAVEYLSLSRERKRTENLKIEDIYGAKSSKETKILLTSTHKTLKDSNLQLARLAMHDQDYAKAKIFALKINQENPKNIESWEIFTKALYLEGNKSEAMSILKKILMQNPNKELFVLLEQMRKGESI